MSEGLAWQRKDAAGADRQTDGRCRERIVALTLGEPPGETPHWTGRVDGQGRGRQPDLGQRIWRAHGLAPHRIRTFKRLAAAMILSGSAVQTKGFRCWFVVATKRLMGPGDRRGHQVLDSVH